ncbi:MAG: tRNA (N6-isopentenyl adenosine(37)-C2)-methylthiotransferase MiaB [Proteobacteria bacterium]|nr:tRNA (N6-isopentenyl adenosine(37)-C2)-methylthiotransferase MiaB [Pseudomonadota bacterium]
MEREPDVTSNLKKKVFVETLGCQMNVADSESMLSLLRAENYEATYQVEDADLVLLNTCHIREKATHKVLSRLGALRAVSELNPKMKIAVAGCVAQAEGEKLLAKATNIDILLGPGKIEELPELLARHVQGKAPVSALGFKKNQDPHEHDHQHEQDTQPAKPELKPTLSGRDEVSRVVNIAQGCDNFCTFCVVPFTRGREISRTRDEILAEVKTLIDDGATEITLLGQNVNSYGQDLVRDGKMSSSPDGPFVELLEATLQLPGLERLRFTTSNPHDFSKAIAELFRKYPKLGRYIHLPVQAGNDELLERMKRKVTVAEYLERVAWLRDVDPEMALSTDLIVGFPGETDEQFEETLKLVEAVRYSFVYAFKYSPRKGTAASRFREQVPEDVKSSRLAALNKLQDRITTEGNLAEIGRIRTVLCHYKSRKEPDVYYGRTEQFRLVRVPAQRNLQGKLVQVEILEANKTALVGRLI